jgi:hypothetical protein
VEIDAPAVAGSNTLTLPDGNGTSGQVLSTDGAGALSWGPGVANDAQLCKAWVNFNGTGTVAIRAAYNVSSITDNGTGDYTVNFTTALADAQYAVAGSVTGLANYNSARVFNVYDGQPSSASSVRVLCKSSAAASTFDEANMTVIISR